MPTGRFQQSSFSSGEFDPLLEAREDVSFYYTSAKRISNAVPLPQGGLKRREGMKRIGLQRGPLSAFDTSGATITDPEGGGTPADAYSATSATTYLSTTGIGTGTSFIFHQMQPASGVRITVVDFFARLVDNGSGIGGCTLAAQGGGTWTNVTVGTEFQRVRLAVDPNTTPGTATQFLLTVANTAAADYGTDQIEIYGLTWYEEASYEATGAEPGAVKMHVVAPTRAAPYLAILTAGNVDIYNEAGVFQNAAFIPYAEADLPAVKFAQTGSSLVMYHPDYPPHVVERRDQEDVFFFSQFTNTRWISGEFDFDSVPLFPFSDATTGGQNEIQFINFSSMSAGDKFVFEFNGDVSAEVTWNATMATNVTNITAALEGLDDITSVTVTDEGGSDVSIEFDGADANTFFATLIVDILTGSGTAEVSRTQPGKPNQEPLWSSTRGYPRCGTFYQGRHWMAGFKGAADVIVGSRAGDFTDFKEDASPVATSPLVLSPDTDQQVTIFNLFAGRNLQIFASGLELYIPTEPITPDNVALKVSSRRGSQELTQPVDIQGGTLFVDNNGTAIREYLFTEAEQNYTAEAISLLAGHLVSRPVDMALRPAASVDDPTILYLINSGRDADFEKVPPALCVIDRRQQVTAFSRIDTTGEIKSIASTENGICFAMTERQLAGNLWNYLEVFDGTYYLDSSERIENLYESTGTATAGQTTFITFFETDAAGDEIVDGTELAFFTREDATDEWVRLSPDDYALVLSSGGGFDNGTQTFTLNTGLAEGTTWRVAWGQSQISASNDNDASEFLNGQTVHVMADGKYAGTCTIASNGSSDEFSNGVKFYHEVEIGLMMRPSVTLQAYKGQGGMSPTMQKQRIFRSLLSLYRTSTVAIGSETGTLRNVPLTSFGDTLYEQDLRDILLTGTKRISGLGRWETEPRLVISQIDPGPWHVRSCTYDVRL